MQTYTQCERTHLCIQIQRRVSRRATSAAPSRAAWQDYVSVTLQYMVRWLLLYANYRDQST